MQQTIPTTPRNSKQDAVLSRQLLRWFDASRRDLPWRVPPGSPRHMLPPAYSVFVSEAMLQQTQVATVIPYFNRFVAQFPTFDQLANADEQAVLRAWQGLGYYSRARNLQAAARKVVSDFAGILPKNVDDLLTLPGVGRYTAGAIASIAFDQRAPILDGNVVRVICRLEAIEADPKSPAVREKLWSLATEMLPNRHLGHFNSAMMELGATVCLPRKPQCLICPIASHCRALREGKQDRIPLVTARKQSPLHRRWTFAIRDARGRWLIERRPPRGRWAGMWQFPTVDLDEAILPNDAFKNRFNIELSNSVEFGKVSHALTHRRYEFRAVAGNLPESSAVQLTQDHSISRKWISLTEVDHYPMSKPQLAIARMISSQETALR